MSKTSVHFDPEFIVDPQESYEENFQRYHLYIKAEREVYIKYFGSDEDPMHCPYKARAVFDKEVWSKWLEM